MTMDKVTSGRVRRDAYVPFRSIALPPANLARAQSAMHSADKIADTAIAISNGICRVSEALIASVLDIACAIFKR